MNGLRPWIVLAFTAVSPLVLAHPGLNERIERLDELIQHNPARQSLHIKRGSAYSHARQWDIARQEFELARSLGDPRDVDYEYALMLYHQGQFLQSLNRLDSYLEGHPEHEQSWLYKARAAAALGRAGQAVENYRHYFEVAQSPQPGDYLAAARVLAEQTEPRIDEALALLDLGMVRLGVGAQLQGYAIELEHDRGYLTAAIARCETLRQEVGDSPHWKVQMAQLLLAAKRSREAHELLAEASNELDQLRVTPARRELSTRVAQLRAK